MFGAKNMVQVVRLVCEERLFSTPLDVTYTTVPKLGKTYLWDLDLASLGYEYKEAAIIRGGSAGSVKNNREEIRHKLGAKNMCHAVRLAFEAGILPLTES